MLTKAQARTAALSATDDRTAAAWSFVLQHYVTITRYAGKFATPVFDAEDLFNETIVRIVSKFSFDAQRGEPRNYIYWAVRASVVTDWRRNGRGRLLHFRAPGEEAEDRMAEGRNPFLLEHQRVQRGGWGHESAGYDRARAHEALMFMTRREREALVAEAEELDHYGTGVTEAERDLAALR